MRAKITISTLIFLLVAGCGKGDYSKVPSRHEYCADKGGVVFISSGGHPGAIYCLSGDHTHKQ